MKIRGQRWLVGRDWAFLAPALLVGVWLLARNVWVWDETSVDVLYWDQWDFWAQMFRTESGLWDMFNHQHGPHKEGVGYFFLYGVAKLSGWNLRAESLALIGVSAVTTGVFLWLKRRLFGRWDWSDAAVPLMCLSFAHYEIYFIGTNPGLNVLPLLLVALIGVGIAADESLWKYICLVVLGFCATYTGFAVFAGLLVPVYCLATGIRGLGGEVKEGKAWWAWGACSFSAIGFWSFFWDYRFSPAAPDFRFPHEPVGEYWTFISRYWAYFFNLAETRWGVLSLAGVTLLFSAFGVWRGLWRGGAGNGSAEMKRRDVVAFLCLFSLLYSLNVAIGRVGISVDAGKVSRYLTFLVPLWFGAYLLVLEFGPRVRSVFSVVLLALLTWSDWTFERSRVASLVQLAENKRAWVEAYLETGSIVGANEVSRFEVYPFAWAYERQETLIDQMEREGVGFVRSRAGEAR